MTQEQIQQIVDSNTSLRVNIQETNQHLKSLEKLLSELIKTLGDNSNKS